MSREGGSKNISVHARAPKSARPARAWPPPPGPSSTFPCGWRVVAKMPAPRMAPWASSLGGLMRVREASRHALQSTFPPPPHPLRPAPPRPPDLRSNCFGAFGRAGRRRRGLNPMSH
eukprot:4344151-Pyramimonas_sp.AAC.1